MAGLSEMTQPRVHGDHCGSDGEHCAPGAPPALRPRRTRGTEEGKDAALPRPSWWSAAEQEQFRTWLRVYAEAPDADVRAHAQTQLAHIML